MEHRKCRESVDFIAAHVDRGEALMPHTKYIHHLHHTCIIWPGNAQGRPWIPRLQFDAIVQSFDYWITH